MSGPTQRLPFLTASEEVRRDRRAAFPPAAGLLSRKFKRINTFFLFCLEEARDRERMLPRTPQLMLANVAVTSAGIKQLTLK